MRLLTLYLRSRLIGWGLLWLGVSGATGWVVLGQIKEADSELTAWVIVIPLMPAVVIGASARTPFGDVERTASARLPLLRFGHLAGLLGCGAAVLLAAAAGWPGADIEREVVRNLAGYTGLALLGARLIGSGIAWVVPLGYATFALVLPTTSRWAWPARIPSDGWSLTIASLLIAAGLIAASQLGARESKDE